MKTRNRIKYRRMSKIDRVLFHINKAKRKIIKWSHKDFDVPGGIVLGLIMGLCFIGALFI